MWFVRWSPLEFAALFEGGCGERKLSNMRCSLFYQAVLFSFVWPCDFILLLTVNLTIIVWLVSARTCCLGVCSVVYLPIQVPEFMLLCFQQCKQSSP